MQTPRSILGFLSIIVGVAGATVLVYQTITSHLVMTEANLLFSIPGLIWFGLSFFNKVNMVANIRGKIGIFAILFFAAAIMVRSLLDLTEPTLTVSLEMFILILSWFYGWPLIDLVSLFIS